ncbi:BREX-1 system adenine-specific DNA-methyltransferase PglX [Haloferula sp.]|uniref:BREX-1 system adenine-specific DNA-methyltransferase PglX n=1 Tax=Haloferula sp. TaxID=2497595 RepID=UPI00329B0697
MNTSKLKSFAPECRILLMEQVGVKLDYVLTAQTPDLAGQAKLVKALQRAVEAEGRGVVIEKIAYTWFNRLAALRYLDARGWHPFRVRVLTPAKEEETQPELLRQVRQGVIPDELQDFVSTQRVNDLLDGKLPSANPQAEVQRLLVIGVCQYYAFLLPDLFERIDDFSQLLLPDDLLTEHSAVYGFRTEISDDDCSEVEILGWLYQFYISEKKDAVMARKKAVPSEDIPAVTQLFTPHWIVRYLVENSLGRLWLNSRPTSRLREHMPYFVEDAPQVDSDQCSVVSEEGSASGTLPENLKLNTEHAPLTVDKPEDIRLLDPACGSGHMLTYAFDLLVKIYEEEGHAPSEIPEKILTHNLFGLEICPRAAQLAQFALVCKAREHSRAAFRRPVQPQVMVLQNVVFEEGELERYASETENFELNTENLAQLHQFREHTETFGSLIQPVLDGPELTALVGKIGEQAPAGDLLVQNTHRKLRRVLDQAEMLSQRYQVAVLNPPYLNRFNAQLKLFIECGFRDYKSDLFSAFVVRSKSFTKDNGLIGLTTPNVWMYIKSHYRLRSTILTTSTIRSLVELSLTGFSGATVQLCAFIVENGIPASDGVGSFIRLVNFKREEEMSKRTLEALQNENCRWMYRTSAGDFTKIPGNPLAYWLSDRARESFLRFDDLATHGEPRLGMATGNNDTYVRFWQETSLHKVGIGFESRAEAKSASGKVWFPYNKGGAYRRWYGNNEHVVNWHDDGHQLRTTLHPDGKRIWAHNFNLDYIFKPSLTFTATSSSYFGIRYSPSGFLFDNKGSSYFSSSQKLKPILGFLGSKVASFLLQAINPTVEFQPGNIAVLPFNLEAVNDACSITVDDLIELARTDWDNFETSWDFRDLPLLRPGDWEVEPGQPGGAWKGRNLAESWDHYATYCTAAIRRMQELETENNRLWIDAYGLQDELTPEVPEDEITLARADARKDMAAFLSYAVGCMMGRYSLDHPGLILADAGDSLREFFAKVGKSEDEVSFLPDDDAIIPITEDDWFEDDAASRVREFLRVTFGPETLDENVAFLEESLGKDLRKYFTANTGGFYADHVKTYKKRPIYWLFQSPKKHFRALVYLHRYTKDTVNTLLNGYLREFHHKLTAKIDDLQHSIDSSSTSAGDKTRAQKALDKAQAALRDVEDYERDILLPLAQQRLEIDLDDGVKANYPKFGKALAKVTGLS